MMKKEVHYLYLAIVVFISLEIVLDLWIIDASEGAKIIFFALLLATSILTGFFLAKRFDKE